MYLAHHELESVLIIVIIIMIIIIIIIMVIIITVIIITDVLFIIYNNKYAGPTSRSHQQKLVPSLATLFTSPQPTPIEVWWC